MRDIICRTKLQDEVQKARNRSQFPAMAINTLINFVPQQEAWIVERFGKFHKILSPGLAILLPGIDKISYRQSLKETSYEIPQQSAITADNVTLAIDGVLFTRVIDPYKASYNINRVSFAVEQLAQTAMRSEIGHLTLDNVLRERQALNQNITQSINQAALDWGITCFRYEIKDIRPPQNVLVAMEKQLNAERTKRAEILDSEGRRESAVNKAQGEKSSAILKSQAQGESMRMVAQGQKDQSILVAEGIARKSEIEALGTAQQLRETAKGEADKMITLAEAEKHRVILQAQANSERIILEAQANKERLILEAEANQRRSMLNNEAEAHRIRVLSEAFMESPANREAANMVLAREYMYAFTQMGQKSNTMVIPSNMTDMTGMVTSGMALFDTISQHKVPNGKV